ncbi:MAG: tetratricopeptide repeat-containing sensor histidine kinase [Ferruginibacter sp.]
MHKHIPRLLLQVLFFIFCPLAAVTQTNKTVDSLLIALDTEKADSNRMMLYRRIGTYYTDNNAGKAIGYIEKSQEIAKKLNRPLLIANNYYSIGFCYLVKGNFNKSLENYFQSIRIYETLKDSFRLSNAFMSVGNLYGQNKNFQKTIEYYDKAQLLIEAQKDSAQLSGILGQRGILYDQQLQYDKAIDYLRQALLIARIMKDDYMITNTLSNIGLTYKHQKKTPEALQFFDSVITAYKTTKDVPVDNYAAIYNNIAAAHSQAGNYPKAKEAFDKSIQYALQAGSPFIEMENYNNLADMYGTMKSFELQTIFLKKYYNIKDSLFTADNKNQLTQLEADYQVEKKNVELQKKDAEVIRQKSQRNISIIIAIAIAVILTTLAFFYRGIKKNNRVLLQKNILINHQKNELETLNQVKDRLFSIISHDLRNPLVTLRSYLSLADDVRLSTEKKELFKRTTMQAVSQTCDMLDNLLVWANLQIKNTEAAVEPLDVNDCVNDVLNTVQQQANQKEVTIKTNIEAVVALGDHTILTIALRNILTNAIKYSPAATTVYLHSLKKAHEIHIMITDEGIGMTNEQLQQSARNQTDTTRGTHNEKGSGLGIFLVKELLQKINGHLLIESEKDKGSCFTIVLSAI